ncbi:hypothetical protein RQP54_14410 [Curvibacter sp. APW13]|uniref:hypothetical protein n=1 Tax=Curvibacter sp. APW13 TaxID=3077236 RepID=UPI0028DFBFFE|nr:hypothetical protein [Curvibacter sp. APW13]MDT8992062.1 hypothetical protein [Curvibacter sp. APW13]
MERWMHALGLLALVGGLWGCAGTSGVARVDGMPSASERQEPDVFPGGLNGYNWGYGQTFENFANVEIAQSEYSPQKDVLWWGRDTPSLGTGATMGLLTAYWPLHVRWKLKDGREFILENIDLRPIMREYFRTHRIELQWQREKRERMFGDFDAATLIHQVKDDTVLIEWVVTINKTPPDQRILPNGKAARWEFADERFPVTTLKGQPTSGIDFTNQRVLLGKQP